MMKWISAISFFFVLIFYGCVDKQREQQLQQREAALLIKEKEFALKDADYQSLIKMRDSILALKKDTTVQESWPDYITGTWNSKVICTESNCSDYVIGDVRADQWEFGYDSTGLITKISSNNKLTRVYKGSFNDSIINLNFSTDSIAAKQVSMNVSFADITPGRIRGTRTVIVDNGCKAKFSVELIRNTTNPE